MSDYLIELTDAEIDQVSGGLVAQVNISDISQSATARNSGTVTASGSGAIAIGAAASNTALVEQLNVFSVRVGR